MYFLSVALAAAMLMFPVKDVLEQPVRVLTAEEAMQVETQSDEPFSLTSWSTRPIQLLNSKDGYAYITFDISRALYTEESRLYLAHVSASYTPGYAADKNHMIYQGNEGYNANSVLKDGFLKLTVVDTDQADHCNAAAKAFWPNSSDFETTFHSSFSLEANYSSSFNWGISVGNGALLEVELGGENETEFKLSFSKEESVLTEDPFVSAQYVGGNPLGVSWNFEVISSDFTAKTTFTLDAFYLIEVSPKNGYNDEIRIMLDIGMTTETNGIENPEITFSYPLEASYH